MMTNHVTQIWPKSTLSQTKCMSVSMCFRALMLDHVTREVDNIDILTIDNCRQSGWSMKFLEKVVYLTCFKNDVGDASTSKFGPWSRDYALYFGGPRKQILTKKYTITRCRSSGLRKPTQSSVWICNEALSRWYI